MLVQRGLDWFFDPCSARWARRRVHRGLCCRCWQVYACARRRVTEAAAAAAAEYTQAAMGKQIEAGQRQLAAVQASDGAPCAPLPRKVSKSGSFLGGVLGRSSETSLLKLPPKAAALEAFLLLSRVKVRSRLVGREMPPTRTRECQIKPRRALSGSLVRSRPLLGTEKFLGRAFPLGTVQFPGRAVSCGLGLGDFGWPGLLGRLHGPGRDVEK